MPSEILSRVGESGYVRTLLRYASADGDWIDAFLFEPAGASLQGGALVLHQHNSQWSIGKNEVAGLTGDPWQAFGPALARRGVAVLAADSIGFESRCGVSSGPTDLAPALTKPGSSADAWLQYYNQMTHRLVRGDLLMRKMLLDCQAGLEVLRTSVSSEAPIGVIGHSMGGNTALFLGALDTRIQFVCSSGAVSSYRRRLAQGIGLEMALVIPGFATRFDFDDILRCIAPRACLVVSADDDFATEDVSDLVAKVRDEWNDSTAKCGLTHLCVSGGHALDERRFNSIVDWSVAQTERGD